MLQRGYVEHGLEYFLFYVQNHVAHLAACSGPQLDRDVPLGAPIFLKIAYSNEQLKVIKLKIFKH